MEEALISNITPLIFHILTIFYATCHAPKFTEFISGFRRTSQNFNTRDAVRQSDTTLCSRALLYYYLLLSMTFSCHAILCFLGMTRVGDLSREAILSSIREDQDLSILKDDINKNLFNDKKFCKECITACVIDTQRMDFIEDLIDFLIGESQSDGIDST